MSSPAAAPRDFIPAEGTTEIVDRTPEEKRQLAVDAAIISEGTYMERTKEEYTRRLDQMNDGQAIEFMRNLSPADRRIALTVERDGRARQLIFDAFGRAEDDVKAQEEGESAGSFGAARTDNSTEERPVKDYPLDSTSPSDRFYRAEAKRQAGESITGDEADILTEQEKAAVNENQKAPEDPSGLTLDAVGEDASDVDKGMPAINEAKARLVATELASGDDESKTGADVMSEQDEKDIEKEHGGVSGGDRYSEEEAGDPENDPPPNAVDPDDHSPSGAEPSDEAPRTAPEKEEVEEKVEKERKAAKRAANKRAKAQKEGDE